ncbi:MAG: RodZ domain-containing protein [Micropepsaceae bacterium]
MSIVVKLPSASEQRERRLHLRDVLEEQSSQCTGLTLRERRIELGLDEKAVAAMLKIRVDQLKAIELSDFERLPGRTYAVGFVRGYAKLLRLNVEQIVDQFKAETNSLESSKPAELVFPEVAVSNSLPSGQLLVVALVIAVLIYGIAQITMPKQQLAPAASLNSGSVTVVESPATNSAPAPHAAVPQVAAPQVVAPVERDAAPLVQPIVPVIADGGFLTERLVQSFGTSFKQSAATARGAAAVPAQAVPGSSRITLKALEQSYVQVKDLALRKPHSILLARVLIPGESFQAPDRAGLVLLTGNAGGIQVEVDGRSAGVLGKSGQVIKRLPLEPAYFLSRINTSQ